MGIISGSGSFRGRFGDHFRVGDHFGVGIISGAVQIVITMRDRSCIVGKQKISEENFQFTLVFDLSRARLKNLPSVREQRKMPALFVLRACFKMTAKKILKRVGASTQPC